MKKLIFKMGNKDNPYNGEIRTDDGELLVLRATMNCDDRILMQTLAAAPDLLALVEEMVPYLEQMRDGYANKIGIQARAAIAKAKGE